MILNRLLFKETIKKNIWVIVLSSIVFLLFILLPPIMIISSEYNGVDSILLYDKDLSTLTYFIQSAGINMLIPLIGLSCIMGIKSFSYLHSKKQVDFYHSLPIKRSNLFFLNYIIGIITVILPYLVITILTVIVYNSLGMSSYLNYFEILKCIIWCITFYITIYSIFSLSSILTGNTIINLLLGIFLLFIQWIVIVITNILIDLFSSIISIDYNLEKFIFKSPITAIFTMQAKESFLNRYYVNMHNNEFNYSKIILTYILVSIIITFISYLLFSNRKSEKSGVCIAFDKLKSPLKYIGVIIGSIYIGVFFNLITDSTIWLGFGIILGCVLLHFLVEIIYEFDFKAIFKNWYSIFGCVIIAILIVIGLKVGVSKALVYVPSVEEIDKIDILIDGINPGEPIEDRKVIEDVVKLHQSGIDYYKSYENPVSSNNQNLFYNLNSYRIKIGYKMKNGDVIYRYIPIKLTDENLKLLNNISNNKEVFLKRNSLFDIEVDKIVNNNNNNENDSYIEIINNRGITFKISKLESIKQLISILQNEVIEKFESEKGELAYTLNIELVYSNKHFNLDFPIYSNYTSTINFIESKTTIRQEQLNPEDISEIIVENKRIKNINDIKYILENSEPLENAQDYSFKQGIPIYIYFSYNENISIRRIIKKENVDKVTEYLEKNNNFDKY